MTRASAAEMAKHSVGKVLTLAFSYLKVWQRQREAGSTRGAYNGCMRAANEGSAYTHTTLPRAHELAQGVTFGVHGLC